MSSIASRTYLSQLRLLRQLAEAALKRYAIGAHKLIFINHGENTTFRVTTSCNGSFLLRIHRHGYHTKDALVEELAVLRYLAQHKLSVPIPIPTKAGRSLVHVFHREIPEGRYCDLLRWVDGRFIDESVSEKHMFALGGYMGRLRKLAHRRPVTHRRYWTSAGLVGTHGKFGSLDHLPGVSSSVQRKLTEGRRRVFKMLYAFEKKFPERMGLIHADMHFGNFLVKTGGGISAIDFDDCGFGFHAYELVPPLTHLEHMATGRRFDRLKAFLIEGFATSASWDEHDQKILPYLFMARKLMMVGWMNSRSDIPRFRQMVPKSAARVAERLRELE